MWMRHPETVLLRTILPTLVGLVALSVPCSAWSKKKGHEPVRQDPLETEANPQTGTANPPTDNPANPTGTASSGTSGSANANAGSGTATNRGGSAADSSANNRIGRFLVGVSVGAAPCVYFPVGCDNLHQGVAGVSFAWAMSATAPAYLIVPLQVQFRPNQGTLILPVGVQYDISLPVANLYIYPRVSVGYAAAIASPAGSTYTEHYGVAIPEIGLKYVFSGRYHLGGEFFSLPVFFSSKTVFVNYRITLGFGVSF